jgi:glycosyltransferase involved in cell wall biosynthesis
MNFDEKSKILIISSTPPGWEGGGGVLLKFLIEEYGAENFCYYCPRKIWQNEKYKIPKSLSEMPVKFGPLRIFRLHKRRHKLIFLLEEIILFLLLIKRKRDIIKFSKDNNVKLIWGTLRGDALFFVNYVHKKLGVNFIASIQDPVESEWKDRRILYWIKKKNYYKAVKNASYLATAGESMSEYFNRKFNIQSIIQRIGVKIDKNVIITEKEPFKNNIINIAFVGSIYTSKTIDSFLNALVQFLNNFKNYSIVLRIFTNDTLRNSTVHNRLEIKKNTWMPEKTLIAILSQQDIGYLPYNFANKDRAQMQLSFPGKLSTYLAAGIPVFFHGPSYSSVTYFFEKYPCGLSCDSLKPEEIINSLKNMVFDKTQYALYKENCKIALENEFDQQKIFNDFKYFINQGLK